jgi:hypothetical protein
MFDLDTAIAEWRQQMLVAGIKTPMPLEELESHLRDDVEQQMRSGSSVQQAFEIAVGRIGQAKSLTMEFKKVGNMDKAQQRKRAGLMFAAILALYSLAVTWILSTHDLTFNERLSGFASLASMLASVFAIWRIVPRFFPVIANKTVQSAVGIVGGISGMAWFFAFVYFILPCCNFTEGQLLVAVFWAAVPMLVYPTAAFLALDKSESQQFGTTHSCLDRQC